MTGQPRGPRGVALYHWKYSHADIFGLRVYCLSRLSVNPVWGISKSPKFLGGLFAMTDRMDRKCALKVWIESSDEFLRWI